MLQQNVRLYCLLAIRPREGPSLSGRGCNSSVLVCVGIPVDYGGLQAAFKEEVTEWRGFKNVVVRSGPRR